MLVVSNNPLVKKTLEARELCAVEYLPVGLMAFYENIRDRVHLGYRLLTHPLSGSVKPNETPYKSVGISDRPGEGLCLDSLALIEAAIAACRKFPVRHPNMSREMDADFQTVDLTLILSVF